MIELDMEKLNRKIAELTADSYQTFVVLSDKGAVVTFDQESEILPHKPRTYSPELPDAFVSKLAERSAGYSEETGPSGDMTVVTYRQNRLGWSLYVFIKEQYFYQSTAKLYSNYQTIALIWIGVLLFITFTMSRYMTRPIRVLAAKMDRVRDMEVVPNITVTRGTKSAG
ncbi:hypothetical protein N6H14_01750 [Paenibacillus sp. CC-CFT747]|nr:hypothetical protein N6H14_01750 [Paenibacillus sp. CC-CFT747]